MPSIENKRDLPPSLQSLNETPDKKMRKKEQPVPTLRLTGPESVATRVLRHPLKIR